MTKHTCKNCNRIFEYCRGCLLSPIPHMDAGFCSKECYEASKNVVVESEPIKEETLIEEVQPTEEVIEVDTVVEAEIPVVETTEIKNETYNTYKKKKHKYQVHE